ncbi:MAG: hypothetical protein JRJ12_11060 [Deltaproteobacteria bacterium]|nr:hypothetical protein [Deltaproteobacteria bacterium]MBW2072241.1 hypothetical protein [Deltaproteobacteria bacterium]
MANFDKAIPPGGTGEITLLVNTKGFQGKIRKSAMVRSNDPDQPTMKIYITAEVRPYIEVKPLSRIILRGLVGDELRQTRYISSSDNRPFEIKDITSNLGKLVDYKLKPEEGGKSFRLEVVCKATERVYKSGFIKLLTDHPKKKEVRVPVYIRIRPQIDVWPSSVVFGRIIAKKADGRLLKKTVVLSNNRGMVIDIQSMQYNKKYFLVEAKAFSEKPANKYRIEIIALVDQIPAGTVNETLVIQTTGGQEFKVPISLTLVKD